MATITGDDGPNVLNGTAASDYIDGMGGNDTLYGLDGDDYLLGGGGADSMVGGSGNDTYVVDDPGDRVDESSAAGGSVDKVQTSVNYTLGSNVEYLYLAAGVANLRGSGNALNNFVHGNQLANWLGGAGGHDWVYAYDGNDTLDGGIGDDVLFGGNGNDRLLGGSGNDRLYGDAGNDSMAGGSGDDWYYVFEADDVVEELAGAGTDWVFSNVTRTLGAYQENLTLFGSGTINGTGNNLANKIYGGSGANVLNGGGGSDALSGGTGNDTYVLNGGDTVTEYAGGGIDTVRSSVNYTLPNYVEMLVLLGGAVNGTGNALANGLTGNGLANVLTGLGGNDVLEGGAGNDRLDGGLGSDTASYLTATAGVVANLSAVAPQTSGGAGRDTLISIENLAGSRFNDVLTGNAVANVIAGNAGNNLLDGKGGVDTVTYALAPVGVKVSLASTLVQATNWGNDRVLGFENLTGGLFGDTLTGNGLANAIYGGPGNDTMLGLAGNDALDGYTGNDSLAGGLGNDALVGGAGADVFRFDTALNAATNLDAIKDFVAVADTIELENAIFTKLALPGALAEANFSATGVAADADDYVVYNKATGALYYDANGNAAGGTTLFAVLAGSPDDVTAADFVVT